jgi:hypothetical protein
VDLFNGLLLGKLFYPNSEVVGQHIFVFLGTHSHIGHIVFDTFLLCVLCFYVFQKKSFVLKNAVFDAFKHGIFGEKTAEMAFILRGPLFKKIKSDKRKVTIFSYLSI